MIHPTKLRRNGAVVALGLISLWTLVGLFFATAGGGVRSALTTWYLWGALAWLVVAIDHRLPVSRDRLGRRLLWHVPLSLAIAALEVCLAIVLDSTLRGAPHAEDGANILKAFRYGGIHWNLLIYWLIVGAWLAFDTHREAQARRLHGVQLEALLTEARLSALRAQLNPHFLFNALNTVSAYIESDPKLARAMLGHLGDLLRFSLDSEDRPEVTLAEEIEALNHYLAIQCGRFGDRLHTEIDIPPHLLHARVPGLVLQPLVENAITHGLRDLPGTGEVRIAARDVDGQLVLTVADNGLGLPPGWSLDRDSGIGLSNTRGLLAETYGAAHRFTISPAAGRGVTVEIRIPCLLSPSEEHGEDRAHTARANRR